MCTNQIDEALAIIASRMAEIKSSRKSEKSSYGKAKKNYAVDELQLVYDRIGVLKQNE